MFVIGSFVGFATSVTLYQQLPSYIPQNDFSIPAVTSPVDGGAIWSQGQTNVPNGTNFFEATFNLGSPQTVNLSVPSANSQGWTDDYEIIYVDGQPVAQTYNTGAPVNPSVPMFTSNTMGIPTSLSAGNHQVVIESVNTNGYGGTNPNPAYTILQIKDSNGNIVATTANPPSWSTTGYLQKLPDGWFSGAIGNYSYTEYVLQENPSNPVYQQQSFNVQTTAQVVALQSSIVPVQWYDFTIPPDNFGLNVTPGTVQYPSSTSFDASFNASDANWVNSEEKGSADVAIFNKSTMQQVAVGTWKPANGMSIDIPYTPPGGSDLNYVAFLLDTNGNPIAESNQVEVVDEGQGTSGTSYTTMDCGTNGSEIFNTYTNGVLSSTKTVPLTISSLEVDGLYNPPPAQLALPSGSILPLSNTKNGIPVYSRAQAPFDIAVDFPDVTPTAVTATFTVNNGDSIDSGGDKSWSITLKPDTNYLLGYWNAPTIMPKLPEGDTISVTITATDSCGTNTLTNLNFLQVSGDPEWYFTNQAQP